ncbi:hypothetical protein K443DRAFT_682713 [Laccaria amethystina LaAM-08-1]|uniref:Uncharacterized protein n=1 Tax=Laccaria amethystina LaAM-08-1 TaxID=1095629 RepID=A0A0C9X3M3_9AGAR|nr:hypothetical protein K443DRAFT_682713 [Laccaria amethystina LaAM-08-1]
MNNLNRISTRQPSLIPTKPKMQCHATPPPSSLQLSPSPRMSSRVSGQVHHAPRTGYVLRIQRVLKLFSRIFDGIRQDLCSSSKGLLRASRGVFVGLEERLVWDGGGILLRGGRLITVSQLAPSCFHLVVKKVGR